MLFLPSFPNPDTVPEKLHMEFKIAGFALDIRYIFYFWISLLSYKLKLFFKCIRWLIFDDETFPSADINIIGGLKFRRI